MLVDEPSNELGGKTTIVFPHRAGSGGPGSFQIRFEKFLKDNEFRIVYAGEIARPDLVFIVGGTKRIFWLIKMKLKNVPIVYRLDGIRWLHRKIRVGIKDYFLFELQNLSNKIIHAFLADSVIYQSEFVHEWWDKSGWRRMRKFSVIHNGIDMNSFKPFEIEGSIRLVCLEGTIDYSPYAVKLLNRLRVLLPDGIPMDVYGRFGKFNGQKELDPAIHYKGMIPRDQVMRAFQNAIYLSLDIHPACPNSVIEALACGAPVVAFETGSLKELVPETAGVIVPYGSDPWQLSFPDDEALTAAIIKVYQNWSKYSKGARDAAEKNFCLQDIFKAYLNAFYETQK